MKNEPKGEELWNLDVVELLRPEVEPFIVNKHQIAKGLSVKKNNKEFSFEPVTSEQDIVIYDKDAVWQQDGKEHVVPKMICELKYVDLNTNQLIAVSDTASKIKSIFPECKMILLIRYRPGSDELLLHWGQGFDRIMWLETGEKRKDYEQGDFARELQGSTKLREKWEKLVKYIQETLSGPGEGFVK